MRAMFTDFVINKLRHSASQGRHLTEEEVREKLVMKNEKKDEACANVRTTWFFLCFVRAYFTRSDLGKRILKTILTTKNKTCFSIKLNIFDCSLEHSTNLEDREACPSKNSSNSLLYRGRRV